MSYPWRPRQVRVARRARIVLRPRLLPVLIAAAAAFAARVETVRAEPPRTELPQGMTVGAGTASYAITGNLGTITQQSQRAILNWQSFNIGRDAAVHFAQPNANAAALNRIGGSRPSEIFGKLTANGQVYLINRNGVVFGDSARVNVGGLVASALDINDQRFLDGLKPAEVKDAVFTWNGTAEEFQNTVVRLEPGARIETANGGTVMLLAPKVENAGTIVTPEGQAILAAGAKVYLDFSEDPSLRGYIVEVDPFDGVDAQGNPVKLGGTVTNEKVGEVIAERGNVTFAAYTINQLGRISATTSVRMNGSVILKARDTIDTRSSDDGSRDLLNGAQRFGELVLGEDSKIEILPDASSETSIESQPFYESAVELSGKHIDIRRGARVIATGGEILIATGRRGVFDPVVPGAPADDSRIYLDTDAVLDVSGTQHYAVPMERNFIKIRLLGDELKDSPLQRDGFLYRKEVWVDIRRRPQVANVDAYVAQIGRTALERTTGGGTVRLLTEGDVILRESSRIDVSGGSLRYLDGVGRTTQLISNGKTYDIGDAPADLVYTGFARTYTQRSNKWGVERTWGASGGAAESRFHQGYIEGKAAGTIDIAAHYAVLDGSLEGRAVAGPYQREPGKRPTSGKLVIGNTEITGTAPDYWMSSVRLAREQLRLPSDFAFATPLPQTWKQELVLDANKLANGGFGTIEIYSNGRVALDDATTVSLQPGGAFKAYGSHIAIEGDIVVPGGSVALASKAVFVDASTTPHGYDVRLGEGARILTQGAWVNDRPLISDGELGPAFINGGTVTIESASDVTLDSGSLIDVSGGAWLDAKGKLKAGKGGAIAIKSGRIGLSDTDPQQSKLELGGELRGYAIEQGATLTLDTTRVQIGGVRPAGQPTLLHLTPEFFRQGGFRSHTINSQDGMTVASGPEVYPVAANFVLGPDAFRQPGAAGIFGISNIATLPVERRSASTLTLAANSLYSGVLNIEQGAVVRTDPGGEINLTAGRQMTVEGTLDAPAGKLGLILKPADLYEADKTLWIGPAARLVAAGTLHSEPNDLGLKLGEVLSGGSVTIAANGGYLVTEAGSLIDVSGATATLDVKAPAGSAVVTRGVEIASDAGSISLGAREGMLLDGALHGKAGSDTTRGGALTVKLDGGTRTDKGLPDTQSRVVVSQAGSFVPNELRPGDAVETYDNAVNPQTNRYNGRAFVSLDRVAAGGFDSLELAARQRIEFEGSSSLALHRRIALDAPTIAASADAVVRLSAPYRSIGNTWSERGVTTGGTARFEGSGQFIDLKGDVSLSGFGDFLLASDGDLRLVGVRQGTAEVERLPGSLASGGNITLRADQIYPSTKTDFTLKVANNPDGTVTIEQRPADAAPEGYERGQVLSADGRVTVSAPNIEHQGTLKAPFGEIVFGDTDGVVVKNVHVADGAVLSVSGEGMIVPFGNTQVEGTQWIYSFDGTIAGATVVERAPEKRVKLAGEDVRVDGGATINLEGGGDLYAYEFTPGPPGRSKDMLASENAGGSFAIVPWLGGAYAPYDPQYYAGVTGINPGDSIYLSGANGLAAGTYAILPARYALLDGAYLVTPVSGYRDLPANTRIAQQNGGEIVSGYRVSVAQDGNLRDGRASGFAVRHGDLVRGEADYGGSYASRYFDAGASRLPQDAGRLVLAATRALSVEGVLKTAPVSGGRGAEVDITADNIAIVGPNATGIDPRFIQLDADSLTNLNAASLLLGGTRSTTAQGTEIDVTAAEVVVANDTGSTLSAPEVVLVANNRVTLNDGAVVEGRGDAPLSTVDLVIKDDSAALVRVSSGAQVGIVRPASADATKGTVDIKAGAKLAAARSMILDGSLDVLNAGSLSVGSALALGASRVSLGDAPAGTPGLVLNGANLDALRSLDELGLRSYTSLDLHGNLDLGFNNLRIDAPRIAGYGNSTDSATLRASGSITLANAGGAASNGATGTGSLRLEAGDAVRLGSGAYEIAGFTNTTLAAAREIRAEGRGRLDVAGALTLEAPRITATTNSDMTVTAAGALIVKRPAVVPADLPAVNALAANLALLGKNVSIASNIELPSGLLRVEANGADATDHVMIESGANINAGGAERAFADVFAYAPGGLVSFTSQNGDVTIASGATVDVAGVGAGDGGRLEISAHNGTANLDGTIRGGAGPKAAGLPADEQPVNGSFALDAGTLGDFSALNTKLNDGGFTESRQVRVGSGDVVIGSGDTLRAHEVRLVADDGAIDVSGTIDARGTDGGSVELWAAKEIALRNGATIDASATGNNERGGSVLLATSGADNATLRLETGSTINVAGTQATDSGVVHLRAPRTSDGVAISELGSTITGAKRINVEAYTVQTLGVGESIAGTGAFNTAIAPGTQQALAAQLIGANLGLGQQVLHVLPGVEIRTPAGANALDIAGTLDLSVIRESGEPGVLTIRSTGDLNVNQSISDGFNGATNTATLFTSGDSWSYRLVAGADLDSAHASALNRNGTGNFNLAAGRLIRTGTGSIDIAAAGDIELADQKSVIYTAGHNAPSAADFSAPVIKTVPAVYPTDGGDLRLRASGNIVAAPSNQLVTDWQYRQGRYNNDGTINASNRITWYLRPDKFEQGVGALGGGRVSVIARRNISNLSVVVPTSGRLPGAAGSLPDATKLQVFGGGDLSVRAGGDILSGLYYAGNGRGTIQADGSVVSGRSANNKAIHTMIALGDAEIAIRSRGDLKLETVFNPTMVPQTKDDNLGASGAGSQQRSYFFTYGEDSAVRLLSVGGDIRLSNGLDQETLKAINSRWGTIPALLGDSVGWKVYPAMLDVTALAKNVTVASAVSLFPSSRGTLELLAGDAIGIQALVTLPDVAPASLPNVGSPISSQTGSANKLSLFDGWTGALYHSDPVLHRNDHEPVRIVAVIGDITGTGADSETVKLAKPALVAAGRDIRDFYHVGQNLRDSDVTRFEAGRDIVFTTPRNDLNKAQLKKSDGQIKVGGPGRVELIAGRDVDLGSSVGLVSRGNLDNPYLPEGGADILVQAGVASVVDRAAFIDRYLADAGSVYRTELRDYMRRFTGDENLDETTALDRFSALPPNEQLPLLNTVFLTELRESGKEATDTKSERFGDYSRGIEAIRLMYPGSYRDDPGTRATDGNYSPYLGDIKLFFSQIKTEQGGGIDLIAPGGAVNAGLATTSGLDKSASELGIVTVAGGGIRSYVWEDFLVNQSRVFTLQGGDILLWASRGDIDAGRGASAVSAAPPPRLRVDKDGNFVLDFSGAISGSGIAALRANPEVPEANVYLFAPEGTVNAGEAGIRVSGNLTIGAERVIGADVIQVGGVSAGVPVDSAGAAGALAGLGSIASSAAKSGEEGAAQKRAVQDENGNVTFIDVEVLGFGNEAAAPEVGGAKQDNDRDGGQ
jgi:filamentous hemagglutinin family protein